MDCLIPVMRRDMVSDEETRGPSPAADALHMPTPADPLDDMLIILRLYADGKNWGSVNQHATAHRWKGNGGPGYGPARRLLKRHGLEEG